VHRFHFSIRYDSQTLAEESEREIDEIKRQAWHDIEMKRQKFQLMEQEHLARVKAMSGKQ
jgi:hypothetical protein